MPTKLRVIVEYLAALPADRREAMVTFHQAIRKALPRLARVMLSVMGSSLVPGYGKFHCRSVGRREGDWFLDLTRRGQERYRLHVCVGGQDGYLVEQNAAEFGQAKSGRSCINLKMIEDLNVGAALGLVKPAVKIGGINAVA